MDDPPQFTASQHPTQLAASVKAAIAKHYSHLRPLSVPGGDPAAVFTAAVAAAANALPRASIVRQDEAAGALELLDVTALLKFKDDVSVRCVWHRGCWAAAPAAAAPRARAPAALPACALLSHATFSKPPPARPPCRVRQVGGDVVVDVRSASRVGKGDLGTNARRIAAYLAALGRELGLGEASPAQ